MQHKLTYLIANYNQNKYIKDCLNSLLAQTNPHWAAIIYDDASTDDSLTIVRKFIKKFPRKKVQLILQKQNCGKFYGLHKMLHQARSELVAILDADDALVPEATKEILTFYKNNPQKKWAHSHYQVMDESLSKKIKKLGKPIPRDLSYLAFGNITHLISFQRTTYKKIEPLAKDIFFSGDRELIYKLEEEGEAGFIPKILYKYRIVAKSATHNAKNRAIGAESHFTAQQNTLKRREIVGLQKYCYLILFWLIKIYYPYRYPFLVRVFFYGLHRSLRVVFRPLLSHRLKRDE